MRDARAEAYERLGHRYDARVLEPSPPAVTEGPFFADDPVQRGETHGGRQIVMPVSGEGLTWDELTAGNEALAAWAADRWLGAWRRLGPAPPTLEPTRVSLHAIAEHVMKPAREQVNGKFGLRYTLHGFGTPYYGGDEQLRVEGGALVLDGPRGERRVEPATLEQAALLAGVTLKTEDRELEIDEAGAHLLGDWFGFGASVLEQLRAESEGLEPSRVQLWPEHFDIAFELGSEADGRRAGFGASPGDELHPEPYVYVVPWDADAAQGDLWNAEAFAGAELAYSELLAAPDQRAAALDFLRERVTALNAG